MEYKTELNQKRLVGFIIVLICMITILVIVAIKLISYDNAYSNDGEAIFTFVFDSGMNFQLNSVVPIFEEKKLACGFALAPQEMLNNRQYPDIYSQWINPWIELYKHKGYSILSLSLRHSNLQSNQDSPNKFYNEIYGAKEIFNVMQVPINGWVSPYSHINDSFSHLLKNFGYAFNNYTASIENHNNYHTKNSDVHNLTRISLTFDIKDIKLLIVNCIKNKGFICFYGHDDFEVSKLKEIIEYIQRKKGKILAPDEAITKYFDITYKGQVYGNSINNLIDKAIVTSTENNQNYILYLQYGMSYNKENHSIEINIDNVKQGDDIYFYFNVPLSQFSQKDFGKQLYSKFRATNLEATSALYNIRIEHKYMYDNTQSLIVDNTLWREPQTYDAMSYPPINNYLGHVKVIFHIFPTSSYQNLHAEISDMIIGLFE